MFAGQTTGSPSFEPSGSKLFGLVVPGVRRSADLPRPAAVEQLVIVVQRLGLDATAGWALRDPAERNFVVGPALLAGYLWSRILARASSIISLSWFSCAITASISLLSTHVANSVRMIFARVFGFSASTSHELLPYFAM